MAMVPNRGVYGGDYQATKRGATGSNNSQKIAGYNTASLSRLSPEQEQLFSLLFGGASPGIASGLKNLTSLAGGGSPEYWEQLEKPALRQFGQLQGNIASRFSGMGSGARKSSGFQNANSSAAMDFSERLQSQRLQMQQDAISKLLGIGNTLLGRDTRENVLVKSPWLSFFESLGQGVGQGAGALAFA
jgi:hypothetical protein